MENFTNVYIKRIPEETCSYDVYPIERAHYISSSSNIMLKNQRYWVWKLLEEAIAHSFSKKFEDIKFSEIDGRWVCNGFHFSLSHTQGAVAVAVSTERCGIDIENLSKRSNSKKDFIPLAKRICTENEISKIHSITDLISLWTKKESIFKSLENQTTAVSGIESENYICETHFVEYNDNYIFSVCCNTPGNIYINIL